MLSPVAKARIHLHGLHLGILMGFAAIITNALVPHRPWWEIMAISMILGFAVGVQFAIWHTRYHFAWKVQVRHLDIAVTDVSLWCHTCALPSGVTLTGTEISKNGVTPLGSQHVCRRCGMPVTVDA